MTTALVRKVLRLTVGLAVLAAVVVATGDLVQRIRPDGTDAAAPVAALTVAVAERADLSDVVALDGTVETNATVEVLHRIEGATPSTPSSGQQDTSTSGQPPAATQQGIPQGFRAQSLTIATETVVFTSAPDPASDESTSTSQAPVPTTATTAPATSEVPAPTTAVPTSTVPPTTTVPATSTPPTCATTTTTQPAPEAPQPSTPPASTPAPSECPASPTSTTTPETPAPSTGPSIGGTGGGRPTGFPSSGAPSGGGTGDAVAAATEALTERVTSLPTLGTTIELGDSIYSVDGSPVIAMSGTLPQWRSLDSSSDGGIDIVQLETSLLALGYDDDGALVVDTEWDSATTRAVKAWQQGYGLEATGEVALGDIVFLPDSSATVTAIHTTVGADVTEQDPILDVSGQSQRVVATVSDDATSTVIPGLQVQLDGEEPIDATVTLMRSVTSDDGGTTVQAVVTPNHGTTNQAAGSSIDVLVPVAATMSDAVTVPADALVSRLDGTYAVQVRDTTGDHWEPVEILEVQGSRVAVAGLDEGTQVLVPQ